MHLKHFKIIFILLFFIFIFPSNAQFDNPSQSIEFPDNVEYVELIYPFTNRTDQTLKYDSFTSSCNCFDIKVVPEENFKNGFQPGDVGAFLLLYRPGDSFKQSEIFLHFFSGNFIETFKLNVRAFRIPHMKFTSDKLIILSKNRDRLHRVKLLNNNLSDYTLNFDDKLMQANIVDNYLTVRSLRNFTSRDFIEIIDKRDGKEKIIRMIEVNYLNENNH